MFHLLDDENADALWLKAAAWFEPNGQAVAQEGRGGHTAEVLHAALTLRDPRQRWITSRSPAINPAFALAEVIWIMRGRNDSAFLNYFNPTLPRFAGREKTYHGAYGHRLREHFGLDQLERAYRALSTNPKSRQIVLQIWDSSIDLPDLGGNASSEDIPCNISSLLKVRDNHLEWTQIMRSNDLLLGLPHNIVQFTSLQEILAGWLNLKVGTYNHYADSLHIYKNENVMSTRLVRLPLPKNFESISFPKAISDKSFLQLEALGDSLASPMTDAGSAFSAFQNLDIKPAFRSWAAILTADALRRRKDFSKMNHVMQDCKNSCLVTLFERWLQRNKKYIGSESA